MCNLYAQKKSQDVMRQIFRHVLEEDEELIDTAGNPAPTSGIFLDYEVPTLELFGFLNCETNARYARCIPKPCR